MGRALAGWPAISLLVSIKMLFSMFDHDEKDHRAVRDDQRTVPDGPSVPGDRPGRDETVRDDHRTRDGRLRPGRDRGGRRPGRAAPAGAAARGGAPVDRAAWPN